MRLSITRKRLSVAGIWHRQVGRELKVRRCFGGREFAAVQFVPLANASGTLIDVRKLAVCILQDEFGPRSYPKIRFAVYRLAPPPWGVTIGSSEQVVLDKDLASPPRGRASGRHFAAHDNRWLPLALRLDRCLSRHARHPHAPRTAGLRFPQFWASLRTPNVTCDGPEFAQLCDDFRLSDEVAQLTCARRHRSQVLYPVEFVSHLWREFNAIYADLQHFFLRQVIRLDGANQLSGFDGCLSVRLAQIVCQPREGFAKDRATFHPFTPQS